MMPINDRRGLLPESSGEDIADLKEDCIRHQERPTLEVLRQFYCPPMILVSVIDERDDELRVNEYPVWHASLRSCIDRD